MLRDLFADLVRWKTATNRKPLIIRGARQVGKSWLIRELGKTFDYFIEINFEARKIFHDAFKDELNAETIIERLRYLTNIPIIAGKTLLFLDEIQDCEAAINSLRYFKEELPELHVIAAGSLLDFALEKIGLPVGRVQFNYLHPLSFGEFLTATGQSELRRYANTHLNSDPVIHEKLLNEVKTYLWLGGLPEVVQTWINTKNINACLEIQDEILLSFKQDIPKYAKTQQFNLIETVFAAVPQQTGNKFIYKNIDPSVRSYLIKDALHLLNKAGLVHIFYHSDAQGLPLGSQINATRFKVFGFDIGLMQRSLGHMPEKLLKTQVAIKHLGNIAEQFVAQEYIAYSSVKKPAECYYWHREDKQSNAEVDFIFVKNGEIFPIEVKSSSTGHLKSLMRFLETHPHSKLGLKISEALYQVNPSVISIPFYNIENWLSDS